MHVFKHVMDDDLGEILALAYFLFQLIILFGLSINALFAIPGRKYKSIRAKCSFFMVKLWFEMTWKMRFVYMTYIVHVCDTVTDLWILVEWYFTSNASTDSLNSKNFTYISIGILATYKVISCLAVYFLSNFSNIRALAHFFDLLLLEEMFISDESIVKTIKYKRFEKQSTNAGMFTFFSFYFFLFFLLFF